MIQSCGQPGAHALVLCRERFGDVLQRRQMSGGISITESMVGDEGDAAAEQILQWKKITHSCRIGMIRPSRYAKRRIRHGFASPQLSG